MTGSIVEGYREAPEKVRKLTIVTPEGVPLDFVIATPGERVWGFFIDCLLILAVLLVVLLPLSLFSMGLGSAFGGMFMTLLFFGLRNFYFTFFEIRWQGATPGKRRARTRVIDRRGRPLASGAVFVRNLTRELELFIPLLALSAPDEVIGASGPVVTVVAVLWLLGMILLPLFNRDRLRVGDLIAGTLVVRAPEAVLYPDLAGTPKARTRYTFTPEQLDVYGIYELQVLEELLRQEGTVSRKSRKVVAKKIIAKIGWHGDAANLVVDVFLNEFYTAQRARLERRMLFGERREKKAIPRGKKRRS